MTNRWGRVVSWIAVLGMSPVHAQVPTGQGTSAPNVPFARSLDRPSASDESSWLGQVLAAAATTPVVSTASATGSSSPNQTPAPPKPLVPQNQLEASDEAADESVVRLIVGRGRVLSIPSPISSKGDVAVIAVGDPTVADFEVLPNPRLLRLVGKRPGTTDLTLVTSEDQTLVYEIQVQYDLTLIQAQLRKLYPGALVRMTQLGDHLILEGQARDQRQIVQIENTVQAFLDSSNPANVARGRAAGAAGDALSLEELGVPAPGQGSSFAMEPTTNGEIVLRALPESTPRAQVTSSTTPQLINLMTLPGVQQVMLQVRIAELNRTSLREIGADTFFEWGPGNILGTKIAGATPPVLQGMSTDAGATGAIGPELGSNSTAFGIFPTARMDIILRALRENSVLRILAEPNLVSLSGHEASFLAGGEFPVPVAQGSAIGAGNITVQYKEFGVQLNFVPYILDDDVIRLEVRPEVSSIDDTLGTTLVVGGDPTPGVNTRRVHTTVQMREGETLALAGLLQVNLEATTSRIPGLGDLPYIGPLFSNTSHARQEKELLVLVTPFLISPMNSCEVPPLPGAEIQDPNDLEFYFLNRIEGRTGRAFRSTTSWDDPYHLVRKLKLERDHMCGPMGFSSTAGQNVKSK